MKIEKHKVKRFKSKENDKIFSIHPVDVMSVLEWKIPLNLDVNQEEPHVSIVCN